MLNEFKTGNSPIMVATDVASRGIGEKTPPSNPFSFLSQVCLLFIVVLRIVTSCNAPPAALCSRHTSGLESLCDDVTDRPSRVKHDDSLTEPARCLCTLFRECG